MWIVTTSSGLTCEVPGHPGIAQYAVIQDGRVTTLGSVYAAEDVARRTGGRVEPVATVMWRNPDGELTPF